MKTKFNFNSQIATTREQSERLIALGLKKKTADMVYYRESSIHRRGILAKPWRDDFESSKWHYPAWSLNRLIEMMPLDVIPEGGFDNVFTLTKGYPSGYSVEYDGFSYYHKENIYNTLIEGIEHLIEEGYFNNA